MSFYFKWLNCPKSVTHNSKICVWNVYFDLMFIFFMFGRACRFLAQLCGYKGIEFSSPTLASAISNLTPAWTYILAVIFRSFFLNSDQQLHSSHIVPNFLIYNSIFKNKGFKSWMFPLEIPWSANWITKAFDNA